jgi:hypothetical protein
MRLLVAFLLAALACLGQPNFYPFTVDQDHVAGAADFSFLNHPITPADRLFVRDGHFYRVGRDLKPNTRDDERVRLFGVNLAFSANFPEPADAVRVAKRLRRLGVNLVRLHHMDSSPDARPENAGSLLTTGPYPTLNPYSIPRLRGLLDAFKAEGIYANLNLHVGYQFRPDVDQVPPVPGLDALPKQSKPLHIFYPRMVDLQVKFTGDVIAALKLKGDPVLGMVEIDNETSLLEGWGRGQIDRYVQGAYREEWQRQWRAFAKDDAPMEGDRYSEFMADRDRAYLRRMLDAIRASTDPLVPVTGTQMGYGGLLNLDTHADMDYQDNHFYQDHYNFPHQAWDARDWRIRDSSGVATGLMPFVNMAMARVAGQPYTVSEFNQAWPNRQAAEIDTTLAAFGAFQDWDSIMHFAYSHGRGWDGVLPSGFDINTDWGKWPGLGQSAWLFRTAAVSAGKSPVVVAVDREMQMKFTREKRVGAVAPFLASIGIDPAVAFLHPVSIRKASQAAAKIEPPAAPYRSDTGELTYDKAQRTFIIKAAKVAGAVGYFRTVDAGAAEIELVPNGHDFASILLTPLDNRPLAQSRHMLLSSPGYTMATVANTNPPRRQELVPYPGATDWWTLAPDAGSDKPAGSKNAGVEPIMMERVESYLTLRTNAKKFTVYPLGRAGERLTPIAASEIKGKRIHLCADAPWFEIVAE